MGLHRSPRLLLIVLIAHLLAAGCAGLLPWAEAARYLLLAIVVASLWRVLRPPVVVGLRLGRAGELTLELASGEQLRAAVLADTAVFRALVVLRVQESDRRKRWSIVLLPDSMSGADHRLLRLWLRWLAQPSEQTADGV
ncbi:protein YgfX [Accumulibacter sp.]|uniref:protein YgfX n=1 Tax=Accumulibacter sp. TaxID=2053492 RepID=UPI002879DC1D|nr:protein YgfX [Accumulibacter sp.]MDS4050960.1 protein YgfX [Accumulibacter sp.]